MIPYNQVVNGLAKYIDSEIVSKIGGWQKLALGVGLGIGIKRGNTIVEQMKSMPFIKMLNIIDEQNMVDVEIIYEELKKQAQKEPIHVALPTVGTVTFTQDDVDKLYNHIMGGAV